jgi:phosphatidylglycerophosphate synthase
MFFYKIIIYMQNINYDFIKNNIGRNILSSQYYFFIKIIIYMQNINSDDYISNKILEKTSFFENIHPNIVTFFGIIANIIIFKEIRENNYIFIGFLFIFRWLCDCLDGNIARKYKKTSDLGNYLDTLSDFMLIAIFLQYIFMNYLFIWLSIYLFMIYLSITKYKILQNHNLIKNSNKNKIKINFDNSVAFIANNSYIPFILYYIFLLLVN